jgi:hypothetical protein
VAEGGELVDDPGWDLGEDLPGGQAVAFHPAQGLGQHLGCDAAEVAAHFRVPHRAVAEQQDDEHRPLVTDAVQHEPRWAVRVEQIALLRPGPLGPETLERTRRCDSTHEVPIAR